MKILHYGGNWQSNIGNAFIDYGSMESLRRATPNSKIIIGSKYPQQSLLSQARELQIVKRLFDDLGFKERVASKLHFMYRNKVMGRNPDNVMSILGIKEFQESIDYITLSGTCLSPQFLKSHYPLLKKAKGKIIINGGGMEEYTYSNEKAIYITKKTLKELNVYAFIARDEKTYCAFSDVTDNGFKGIDCAFFLNDCFEPVKLKGNYIVSNFDSTDEPVFNGDVIRTHHSYGFYEWTQRFFGRKKEREHLQKPNTIISELPDDYINIYANAKEVHTDRVHTAVVSLIYGTPVKLYSKTPRKELFERVGASNITEELTTLDFNKLKKLKEKQIKFLSKVIK